MTATMNEIINNFDSVLPTLGIFVYHDLNIHWQWQATVIGSRLTEHCQTVG